MINDHDNQHSNTYPFHGDRSDHLEKISSKLVWIVGNQQIQLKKYHMSCFTCHMSENDFDVLQELELLKNLKRWNQPGELTRE